MPRIAPGVIIYLIKVENAQYPGLPQADPTGTDLSHPGNDTLLLCWVVCCQPGSQPQCPPNPDSNLHANNHGHSFAFGNRLSEPNSQPDPTVDEHGYRDTHSDRNRYTNTNDQHDAHSDADLASNAYQYPHRHPAASVAYLDAHTPAVANRLSNRDRDTHSYGYRNVPRYAIALAG